MYNKIIPVFLFLLTSILLLDCAEESNPQLEADTFTSIFDNNQFDAGFTPIDIQQTSDGGYVVLSERNLHGDDGKKIQLKGIYILKTDKFGNFESGLEVGDSLMNPVGRLTAVADRFYFFCMENTASTANPARVKLASFDAALTDFTTASVGGLQYPAASSFVANPDRFVLLSFNNDEKQSIISLVSTDGATMDSKGYTVGVGDQSEEPIMNHYLRTGKQFPFDVGYTGSTYYFNGFFDYTFSLVFTDIESDDPVGIVLGQDDDGGFSAVASLGGNKFSAARFNYGDNYFVVNAPIVPSAIVSSTDNILSGHTLPELIPDARVKILPATIDTKSILIYGSDTQTRQIGLYFYDAATGAFISSRYLGFSNPFQIGNMIQTSDGGLAVCGTTYLAGRFPRICIFKISKEELAKNAR